MSVRSTSEHACRCCGGDLTRSFGVWSWRTAYTEQFEIGECVACGSLSLLSQVDPSPYYKGYFSLRSRNPAPSATRRVLGLLADRLVFATHAPGQMVRSLTRRPYWLWWFAGQRVRLTSRILDVGSGSGALLLDLARHGFSNLRGVDPFLTEDLEYPNGVRIARSHIEAEPPASADVCVLKHVLEHVDSPSHLLSHVARVLAPNGLLVVEVPVAQGVVWHEFRDNWMALDAPVHRFIPTQEGVRRLLEQAGFHVIATMGTCPDHHLVQSERIARRLPIDGSSDGLSEGHLRALRRRARAVSKRDQCPDMTLIAVKS